MTCIVLVKNPSGGGILAITDEDGDEIAQWPSAVVAEIAVRDHQLVKAWGGWVVDLDDLEVSEL